MSAGPWVAFLPSSPPHWGSAHLHEGLGLQCAHGLHHAMTKLQILLQGQCVDGQEGHVGLKGERAGHQAGMQPNRNLQKQ